MDFEAIKNALIAIGKAMMGLTQKIDRQTEILEQILEELKKRNY
jgi:hypothetical protein